MKCTDTTIITTSESKARVDCKGNNKNEAKNIMKTNINDAIGIGVIVQLKSSCDG